MSEKPILMNGVMVRAILDGRKTETRRPAKIQDRDYSTWSKEAIDAVIRHHSPYSVGDHLYVRETWWAVEVDQIGIQYCVFDDEFVAEESGAKYPEPSELRFLDRQDWEYGRHPNIHMPKKHARLWLEVTGVSAEKVQDITEDGAIAEGIKPFAPNGIVRSSTIPRNQFANIWNDIYYEKGLGWDVNPLVWVFKFKRIEK